MKKKKFLCLVLVLIFTLCACSQGKQTEEIRCGHEAYSDLIARLEAGDYEGARLLIDLMEGRGVVVETETTGIQETEPAAQPEITVPETHPGTTVIADCEVIELTRYNVGEYFEFRETYYISEQSQCQQYITLKEEYQNRLISLEDVKIDVAYLLCEAYGEIDLKAERFRSEYFDIISQEKEVRTLKPDSDGIGWINQMLYFSKKGYFPDYAKDVEIKSGSGKLILQ